MIPIKYIFSLKDLQYTYGAFSIISPYSKWDFDMPNRSLFNRMNKFEMVLLINSLQRAWNVYSKEDCLKIERLIREYMPEEIKTQIDVADWLVLHWDESSFTLPTSMVG
ncbi:hypothetical protein [Desertivirga arenae]|uniref:hypothetical protein n=1 Tax=Desertivirga arenae TaxID=2810309 RepID=UPI001A967225|nr:hypothetical protein [Pedobacter sp. SYSU D00823]